MIIWHCRSQLKNVDSSGIWTRTFGTPVRRSICWAIESTGIGGEFLFNLGEQDIFETTERLSMRACAVFQSSYISEDDPEIELKHYYVRLF